MKRKRRWIILITVAIVLIIIGFVAKIFFDKTERALDELRQTTFMEIDLNSVPNGNYKGYFKRFPVEVELITTVKNGEITGIELIKHVNGQGKDGEKIIPAVVKQQSLKIDVITGATYSSLVILKAVEDSLLKLSQP